MDKTGSSTTKPHSMGTGIWWRHARYEIWQGMIRPVPGSPLQVYDPWSNSPLTAALELAAIISDHAPVAPKARGPGRPRIHIADPGTFDVAFNGKSDAAKARALQWCGQYGLLGILHHEIESGPVDEWIGDSYFLADPAEEIWLQGRFSHTVMCAYMEPLSEFWSGARMLASVVHALALFQLEGPGAHPQTVQAVKLGLDFLESITHAVALSVEVDPKTGRFFQRFSSPSLLGVLAWAFQDALCVASIRTCSSCGKVVSVENTRRKYCSQECKARARKRVQRLPVRGSL